MSYHWRLNDLQKDRPNYSCGLSTTTIEAHLMMLYISAMDHVRKLNVSNYVYLPSNKQNVLISLCLSDSVQRWRGYCFRALVLYFSFGTY